MAVLIELAQPDSADAIALIEELEAHLAPQYPSESRHGLSVEQLVAQSVAFFVVRQDGLAAGCGGVKLVDREYGELKRMYVRPAFRGMGLGKQLVGWLAAYACQHGVPLLRLETGIHQVEAIGLYERMGFHRIAPFGEYRDDPLSLCFEKPLDCA